MNSWKARRPPAWELGVVSNATRGIIPNLVLPAVKDVHERNGEDIGLLGSGEIGDVSVQGDALGDS